MRNMHEVEPLTSHYVGTIVVARFVRMLFWFKMYFLGENFLQLLFADILHTLLSADYMYLWLRKLRYGVRGHLFRKPPSLTYRGVVAHAAVAFGTLSQDP